jgi:hypothetical protein
MKLEKEDKQYFIVGIIACFLIAAIVTFNVWMWRSPNRTENQDSSNEAYNQSKIEAVKWKFKYDSVSVEYARIMAGIEKKINNSNKKIKQNEITKKQDAALSDSAVYILRDSLRAEYRKRYFAKDSIVSSRFFN